MIADLLKNLSLVLVSCMTSFGLGAQGKISFTLQDSISQEPIVDAFLFVEGSSIGTSSNLQGQAVLSLEQFQTFRVVITHVQYETISLDIIPSEGDANYRIQMMPRSLELDEVIVQANRRGKGKRRAWMRRFALELFGPSVRKKHIRLLNPEAIWFEESDSLLEAHAIDNLIIENKNLAYTLRLSLDHFSIDHNDDVRYRGKLHFTDTRDDQKRPSRIDRRRKEIYLESPRFFFQSLIHQLPINGERFRIGSTKLEDEVYVYEALEQDDLTWSEGITADTLGFEDYLTVIVNGRTVRLQNRKKAVNTVLQSGPPTSFLRSSSGRFIVDKRGDVINKVDIRIWLLD